MKSNNNKTEFTWPWSMILVNDQWPQQQRAIVLSHLKLILTSVCVCVWIYTIGVWEKRGKEKVVSHFLNLITPFKKGKRSNLLRRSRERKKERERERSGLSYFRFSLYEDSSQIENFSMQCNVACLRNGSHNYFCLRRKSGLLLLSLLLSPPPLSFFSFFFFFFFLFLAFGPWEQGFPCR